MRRRQKIALVLFLLCLPGRLFFSEQQAKAAVPESPRHVDSSSPPNPDITASQILLNPLFIAHLLLWIILLSLFVIAVMDVMLKCVFYTCAIGVHMFSSPEHKKKGRYFADDGR